MSVSSEASIRVDGSEGQLCHLRTLIGNPWNLPKLLAVGLHVSNLNAEGAEAGESQCLLAGILDSW